MFEVFFLILIVVCTALAFGLLATVLYIGKDRWGKISDEELARLLRDN